MASPLLPISFGIIILIKFYQLIISPLLGPHCRFKPTCSEYGIEALHNFGIIKGSWLILKRLLKCNSLYPGGYDPIKLDNYINNREN